MIHFNLHRQNSGFSFVELMIALFIISTTLSALFNLQNAVFSRLVQSYYRATRILLLKKTLMERMFDISDQEQHEGSEKIKDPSTDIVWKEHKIPAHGSYEYIGNLYRIHVTGSWTTMLGKRTEDVIGIRFNQPEEPQESQEKEQKKESAEKTKLKTSKEHP